MQSLLACVGLCVLSCGQQGPSSATLEEAVQALGRSSGGWHATLGEDIYAKLAERPREEVLKASMRMVMSSDPVIRAGAAQVLGEIAGHWWNQGGDDRAEGVLLKVMEDDAQQVRWAALWAYMRSFGFDRPDRVPNCVERELHDALVSTKQEDKFFAAYVARHLGPAVASRVEDLVDAVRFKDDRVRFAAVGALATIGASSDRVASILVDCLGGDPDANVRLAAAEGLAISSVASQSAVAALLGCLSRSHESDDVWMAAVRALFERVRSAPDAAAALEWIEDHDRLFPDFDECSLLGGMARLSALSPESAGGRFARRRMEAALESKNQGVVLVGSAGLARIAVTARDLELGRRVVGALRRALLRIGSAPESLGERWMELKRADHDIYVPVLESLVCMSSSGIFEVDVNKLRSVLSELAKRRDWWIREWARAQLEQLSR